jgi:Tannase and feruloyl esterase
LSPSPPSPALPPAVPRWRRPLAWFGALAVGLPVAIGPARAVPHWQQLPCDRLPEVLQAERPDLLVHDAHRLRADAAGHPTHCRITGLLGQRIGFEMRMPTPWNGQLLHQTHGGTDGVVKPAYGDLAVWPADALSRGFAVLSSDGGHRADDPAQAAAGLARGVVFGLDPQARQDFAYAALDALWPLAQRVLQLHYGRAPQRNYLAGCGNGGRLGLVAASRWPDRYDGIVAGAPALHWPRAALQHPWDWQQWQRVASTPALAFSPADLRLVADRVLARCDALDLLSDGQVADIRRCQQAFRPAELQCRGAQTSNCLSPAQVQVLQAVFAGPHDSAGRPLYTDWPFDPGIASAGWRRWRIESDIAGWGRQPVAATMGAAALAYLFSTPPEAVPGTVPDLMDWLHGFDFDTAEARGSAVTAPFTESALAQLSPGDGQGPPLAAFLQRGGKLIVYHGAADPAFSLHATLRWTEKLQAHWGLARAQTLARVFAVPGMGHCHGGPGTDRFDPLGALVEWVEQGRAPDRIVAQTRPNNAELPAGWSRQRSRPLCPWPQAPRYAGGDAESADSFRCVMP